MSSNYLWYTSDYPYCHPTSTSRPQPVLTTIQLPLVDLRLSLLPYNYLWCTATYSYSIHLPLVDLKLYLLPSIYVWYRYNPFCHQTTSGRPQTILTIIHLHLVDLRLILLPSNYLWYTLDYPYSHPTTSGRP